MKFWRAVLTGALIWVLVFFEVCILMFGFKLNPLSSLYYIIHYLALAIFVLLASLIYFRKAKAGFLNGLWLWIIFVLVGIVLDSIITIPLLCSIKNRLKIERGLWIKEKHLTLSL